HLVTVCRHPDSPTVSYDLADHPRAGEGFARAWRSLDRQDANPQVAGDAERRLQRRFVCVSDRGTIKAGRRSEEEIPRRLVPSLAPESMVGDILADPEEGLLEHCWVYAGV